MAINTLGQKSIFIIGINGAENQIYVFVDGGDINNEDMTQLTIFVRVKGSISVVCPKAYPVYYAVIVTNANWI